MALKDVLAQAPRTLTVRLKALDGGGEDVDVPLTFPKAKDARHLREDLTKMEGRDVVDFITGWLVKLSPEVPDDDTALALLNYVGVPGFERLMTHGLTACAGVRISKTKEVASEEADAFRPS